MDEHRIAGLERLQRLRDRGALNDGEFAAEKRKVLENEPARPLGRWALLLGAALALLAVGISVEFWSTPKEAGRAIGQRPEQPRVTAAPHASPAVQAPAPLRPTIGLADAFEAATGHRKAFVASEDSDIVTTSPVRIISLPFGLVLLTTREIKDGCHACSGAIGVYYLNEENGQVSARGRWPEAIQTVGWGSAPSGWRITDKFTNYPAVYAEGGFTNQGVTTSGAIITELRPAGPVTSNWIHTGYTDAGSIVDEDKAACDVEGHIANISKDKSFDVIVSGSVEGIDHYMKKGGKFLSTSKRDWGLPCGT